MCIYSILVHFSSYTENMSSKYVIVQFWSSEYIGPVGVFDSEKEASSALNDWMKEGDEHNYGIMQVPYQRVNPQETTTKCYGK
jgi:hypothetical protein